MRANLIASLTAASLVVVVAACTTTPEEQKPAAVVSREAAPPPQVQPVERKPVAAVDLTARRADPSAALKEPNNILSKRSVYFDFDKYDIKDEYKGLVEAHSKYLRENPGAKMLLQGNADERGSREYNVSLGQRRSESVKRALILLGAKEGQVEAVSLGEEKPVCNEHGENCWWKNRRDDMLYGGEY